MRFKRLILATGALTAVGLASAATAAIDPADAIGICSRISKKDARLECYDQVAKDAASGQLRSTGPVTAPPPNWAAPPTATAPSVAPAPAPAPAPQAQAATGFGAQTLPQARAGDGPDSVQAEVTSSTDNGLHQWRIRLADGAIWQMTEGVSTFRPPAPHEIVTIRKGALGSFLMDVGKQAAVRVRRVQ